MSETVVEHPIPLAAFAASLKGTSDEVYTKLLRIRHGMEKHTTAEWRALIDAARREPAHRI
ncbi:MAG: hypothetical protein M0Z28_08340 [Rhodospirillales bacterium]|nr:hypothetical protein [Rhodospirillales bacterium]